MPKIFFERLEPFMILPEPKPATHSTADWWKSMPRYIDNRVAGRDGNRIGTIKNCPAVNDIINSGYILSLPADVYVDATGHDIVYHFPEQFYNKKNTNNFIAMHGKEQLQGYRGIEDYHHDALKWQSFWGVNTQSGYSTMFMHPMHRHDLPFYSIPAIIDTDKFPARDPLAFLVKKGFEGIIPRGTPMVQVFPFKREDFEMEMVEINPESVWRLGSLVRSTFTNGYKKIFWQRKKYT